MLGRTPIPRRSFLAQSSALAAAISAMPVAAQAADAPKPIDIGARRELFVDDYLIERLDGQAKIELHHPQPQEMALIHDAPWEGTGSGYHSVFQDGPLYRMYYKAWHLAVSPGKIKTDTHPLYCCYAESDDGISWRKPELGMHEFRGSKANNIVIASGQIGQVHADAGHPAVFKDENPAAPPESRYKAIIRSAGPKGLLAFHSSDGLNWSPMSDQPVITEGAFDSQNLAFWDAASGQYRAYWRSFTAGVTDENNWKPAGFRAIRTATSADFLHWSKPADLTYEDSPQEHLYTNQIKPYHRAPHMLIGFPTRYVDRGWTDSTRALPELEHREMRASTTQRYGTAVTEGLLMSSRDGLRFKRWNEAFLRPGIEREGTWNYGQQYIAWHLVETKSKLPGAPSELSMYAGESYWTGTSSALRRYTVRLDGFASVNAPTKGGELITKPLIFSGNELRLNFSSSAAGGIQVEIQDIEGKALPNFALSDCQPVFGDSLDRKVTWKAGANVGAFAGQPVRLRFRVEDADLFAIRFAS